MKVKVIDSEIRIKEEYLCLTDMAANYGGSDAITNWIRLLAVIEFLEEWESLHNANFNYVESNVVKSQTGRISNNMSVGKWVKATNAIGLKAIEGRYGGTYAHVDIAMEFATWLSPKFKVHFIKEYQEIKSQLDPNWSFRRELSKGNYILQTDAIQKHLIEPKKAFKQAGLYYASEADMLNSIVFGMTAEQWRLANPDKKGNQRDYAKDWELQILANLESHNSDLIQQGKAQLERNEILNALFVNQVAVLKK